MAIFLLIEKDQSRTDGKNDPFNFYLSKRTAFECIAQQIVVGFIFDVDLLEVLAKDIGAWTFIDEEALDTAKIGVFKTRSFLDNG